MWHEAGREEMGMNGGTKKWVGRWPRRAFEEWVQRRHRVTYDRYRAQRVVVKLAVKVAKRMADLRCGKQLRNDFERNKKMFWKMVKRVMKSKQVRDETVKDVNGQILRDGVEVRRRSVQYFEHVLNVADVREANINVAGNWLMPVLGDLNERAISLVEVREAVNELISGEAPGLDGFPVECLKKSGMVVLEWL